VHVLKQSTPSAIEINPSTFHSLEGVYWLFTLHSCKIVASLGQFHNKL